MTLLTSVVLDISVDHDGEQHIDTVDVATSGRQVERRGGRIGAETRQQLSGRVEQHL